MAKRTATRNELVTGINIVDYKIAAFASMTLKQRFAWLFFGKLPMLKVGQ